MITGAIKFLANPLGALEEERIYNKLKPYEMTETQLLKQRSKLLSTYWRCVFLYGISPREVKLKLYCIRKELDERGI